MASCRYYILDRLERHFLFLSKFWFFDDSLFVGVTSALYLGFVLMHLNFRGKEILVQ